MGKKRYPNQGCLVTADGAARYAIASVCGRLEHQKLADEAKVFDHGVPLAAWNQQVDKIEHRFSSFISINWRGKTPPAFANRRTSLPHHYREGLTVRLELDES